MLERACFAAFALAAISPIASVVNSIDFSTLLELLRAAAGSAH